jgi:Skp family chaperone for outer membrane proteins
MKISKKLMALVAAACVASTVVAEKMDIVVIDSARLLQESESGKALKNQLETEARALQNEQQQLIADLQKAGKEFQTKSKLMSKSAQEQELARLQKMEKKIQRTLQERAAEFQEEAKMQQEYLHRHNLSVAAAMVDEKGWIAVLDKQAPSTVAVNSKYDVTDMVLAELNAEYQASSTQLLVAQNDAQATEEVTAA